MFSKYFGMTKDHAVLRTQVEDLEDEIKEAKAYTLRLEANVYATLIRIENKLDNFISEHLK